MAVLGLRRALSCHGCRMLWGPTFLARGIDAVEDEGLKKRAKRFHLTPFPRDYEGVLIIAGCAPARTRRHMRKCSTLVSIGLCDVLHDVPEQPQFMQCQTCP